MRNALILLCTLVVSAACADEPKPHKRGEIKPTKKLKDNPPLLVPAAKRVSLLATYSLYDMWLPGKFGATVSYGDANRTYEFAYQKAAYNVDLIVVDIGGVSDERYHFTTRSFAFGGSFNWQYGLFYNKVSAHLGNEWLQDTPQVSDTVDISTMGVALGMGNRWSWDNGFVFGIDYAKMFLPVAVMNVNAAILDRTNDDDAKEDLEGMITAISRVPTFTALHFEVGYRF